MYPVNPTWRRHDAHRFIRHDAHRFFTPAGLEERKRAAEAEKAARRRAAEIDAAEQDAFEREVLALRHDFAKLKLEYELRRFQRKYSPDQPRVPAGSPDGGQWTNGDFNIQDITAATSDGLSASRASVAQNSGSGFPVDLTEEERLGGHVISEHVAKSDAYLKRRVQEEASRIIKRGDDFRGLSVGSFSSLDSASRLVNSTLAQNRSRIDLVARGERDADFVTARFGSVTGYEAYLPTFHSAPYMRETNSVGVFVLRDPRADKGWRVQSAFPTR